MSSASTPGWKYNMSVTTTTTNILAYKQIQKMNLWEVKLVKKRQEEAGNDGQKSQICLLNWQQVQQLKYSSSCPMPISVGSHDLPAHEYRRQTQRMEEEEEEEKRRKVRRWRRRWKSSRLPCCRLISMHEKVTLCLQATHSLLVVKVPPQAGHRTEN